MHELVTRGFSNVKRDESRSQGLTRGWQSFTETLSQVDSKESKVIAMEISGWLVISIQQVIPQSMNILYTVK